MRPRMAIAEVMIAVALGGRPIEASCSLQLSSAEAMAKPATL